MVEHSTADREVPGSNPGAPFDLLFIIIINYICYSKISNLKICSKVKLYQACMFDNHLAYLAGGI